MSSENYNRPIPDYLMPMAEALSTAEPGALSEPWKHIALVEIEGLEALGFERTTEMLLVASSTGQTLLDCSSGETIHTNDNNRGFDYTSLKGEVIDGPEFQTFDMCGLYGGGLRTVTNDGWSAMQIPLNWPQCFFILQPPDSSIYEIKLGEQPVFDLLGANFEASAFGFSWTGNSLIKASTDKIEIWGRNGC